ncbi:MAG TPA: DUF1559 domain-containing protein [Gemmataceae bacterium]|jgi:hypothetical protein|nr:DUF1559 domain-containing protein [Gemmataceae bacterium]
MAGPAFKQECPSCGAQVTIRDPALIGKKVKCPTCKYAFVINKPTTVPSAAIKPGAPAAAGAKKPQPTGAPTAAGAADNGAPATPAIASRKKMYLGLGLGALGLAVLVIASLFILGKSPTQTKWTPNGNFRTQKSNVSDPDEDDDGKKQVAKAEPDKKGLKKTETQAPVPAGPIDPPTLELTNLLPGDADHVFHGYFANVFAYTGMLRTSFFGGEPGTLIDATMKDRLGFSPLAVDDLIRADRFADPGWVYVVVHLNEYVDEKALTLALDLKKQPLIGRHAYYKAGHRNAALACLDRLAVGAPSLSRALTPADNQPLAVHIYDKQTILFADEPPLKEFLRNDRKFAAQSAAVAEGPGAAADPNSLEGTFWEGSESRNGAETKLKFTFREGGGVVRDSSTGMSEGSFEQNATKVELAFGQVKYRGAVVGEKFSGQVQDESNNIWTFAVSRAGRVPRPKTKDAVKGPLATGAYSTLDPSLKSMLDRIETKAESGDRLLYSTATRTADAQLAKLPIEQKDKSLWRPRQIWDLTALYEESKPARLRTVGSGLYERGTKSYWYRSLLECTKETEAREVLRLAHERFAPEVSLWIDRLLGVKIGFAAPQEGKQDSYWSATLRDRDVDITVRLQLDKNAQARMKSLAGLLAMQARAELDLATEPNLRHALGRGVKALAENGLADRNVEKGAFPPGSFRRAGAGKSADGPYYRMSWMTSLLPYLGHDGLFHRLDEKASWRDPVNWLPARTMVPQFQDPMYPDGSRMVSVPGIGVELAATHFVGIAGIGLDAAEYDRNDVSTAPKRGVFGYERSATIAELQRNRGAANTILMVQVPHDGLTGVSPWVAGGGSTLRGVPEKNSIAPFVLTTDKTGKAIAYKGHSGTYAVMADGSVRFVDAKISDAVFKAMCTVQGAAPTEDLFADAPLVPDPTVKAPPMPAAVKAAEKK